MRIKHKLKETSGTSIVSVITAFVILMIGISMMTTAITAAMNTSTKSMKIRQSADAAMEAYYTGTATADTPTVVKYRIQLEEGNVGVMYAEFSGTLTIYESVLEPDKTTDEEVFKLYHFE